MQHIFTWLGRRRWFISLPIVIVAGVVAYLLISGLLDWANSTDFCGTTCHVMKPEYTAYQQSFHARVRCAECHVGPGLLAEVEAKWQGTRELWLYLTNTFERPIPSPVENLRPARDTCEHCHWPEVFYKDRAVALPHYAGDEANTRTSTYMLLKIGGGSHRQGQGRGIHWHIENVVEYIATDAQRQNIPWVRVTVNGQTATYVDVTQPISEQDLQQYEVRVMDCIDCHNRATHIFRAAERTVDEAMANGLLPVDLPYLRRQAVAAMQAEYGSEQGAMEGIASVATFYRQNYPDLYQRRQAEIEEVVRVLQNFYRYSHFPEYGVNPQTYPDNIGHSASPGCFRCHDGKHLAQDGSSIRLHCNICHTIPETVVAGQPVPAVPFVSSTQPPSHSASNWMAEHRNAMDSSCASCHQMQTFCANPNCHGRSWPYVNLRAVSPPFPLPQQPTPVTPTPISPALPNVPEAVLRGQMLYAQSCASCHPQPGRLAEEGQVEREKFAQAILQGKEGMPAMALSAAQIDDLVAFVVWMVQNPGGVMPPPTPKSTPPGTVPQFSTDILPLLQGRCGVSCHSAATAAGGFKATDYESIRAVVLPGNPDASRLVQVQQSQHAVNLTQAELERIIAWIRAGAPND